MVIVALALGDPAGVVLPKLELLEALAPVMVYLAGTALSFVETAESAVVVVVPPDSVESC